MKPTIIELMITRKCASDAKDALQSLWICLKEYGLDPTTDGSMAEFFDDAGVMVDGFYRIANTEIKSIEFEAKESCKKTLTYSQQRCSRWW